MTTMTIPHVREQREADNPYNPYNNYNILNPTIRWLAEITTITLYNFTTLFTPVLSLKVTLIR